MWSLLLPAQGAEAAAATAGQPASEGETAAAEAVTTPAAEGSAGAAGTC